MVKLINAYTLSECLEAMVEQIAAFEELGQKNIVFCEDRLTLVAERALLRRLGGTLLTDVFTFSRFLKTDAKTLSREGSVMAVGEIMLSLQAEGRLSCFTSSSSVLTGAKTIYEQLAQFSASELSPEALRISVEKLVGDALKNKMQDLTLIYERYDEFLRQNGFLDEGKYLTLLPDCIKNAEGMSEMNVFFLCYSSFTKQAKRTLEAAMKTARNTVGIFLAGDEELYTNEAYGAFAEVGKEVTSGKGGFKAVNLGRALDGEAEKLRKNLFAMECVSEEAIPLRMETDKIRIFAAADRTGEAEYVAVNIRKMLMENEGLHYRDFAVLVPAVGEYSLAFRKAFSEYGIPYSLDERISLKQHPLAKFILAVLNAVQERFTPSSVDDVARNLFFGEGDKYRNYLMKYACYRGGVFKPIKALSQGENGEADEASAYGGGAYLEECKVKMEGAFALFKGKSYGREYCAAIHSLLKEFDVWAKLNELVLAAEDEGTRSYLSQIEKKVLGVLSEAELLAGGKQFSIDEFAAVLADGLEATEIAPNPLRLDAVFVGDLTDSRIERVRVLFALGMTDAVPRASDDANLITDKDKIKLQEIQAVLEPMVEAVNLRNRESLCLNLCTFTDGLHLCYSLGSNGESPALSDVFRYVKASFVGGDGMPLAEEKRIPISDFAYRCSAVSAAARQLLIEKNDYEERKTDSRTEYSSLFEALSGLNALPQGVDGFVDPHKYIEEGGALFLRSGSLSPSMLETYFDCPYKCFASRGLHLEERQETSVLSVDTGNFIHKLLEIITGQVRDHENESSFAAYAEETGRELLKDPKLLPQEDTAKGTYTTEKLLWEGVEVAKAFYRQIRDSAFTSIVTEKEVKTDNFHGKVDRVDENERFVRVVDYKTGSISTELRDYYLGRKLQMQLYMSAVCGEKTPVGVLYFPASVNFADSAEGRFRLQGFLNGDTEALLAGDVTLQEGKKSEHFDATLNKCGKGKVMTGEAFTDFLDYAVYVSKTATDELRGGYVAPSPSKHKSGTACDYCQFGGMCGFHKERLKTRSVDAVSSEDIVNIVRKQKGEDGNE